MKPEIAQEFSLEELNRVLKNIQRNSLGSGSTTSITKVVSAGIQAQSSGTYDPLGAAAAVQVKLTEHTSATGTQVHGLGSMSVVNGSSFGISFVGATGPSQGRSLLELGNMAVVDGSSLGISLATASNASSARSLLGLGSIATYDAGDYAAIYYQIELGATFSTNQAFSFGSTASVVTSIDATCPRVDGIIMSSGNSGDIRSAAWIPEHVYTTPLALSGSDGDVLFLGQDGKLTATEPTTGAGDVWLVELARRITSLSFVYNPQRPIKL